jgi:hypothetical protein
LESNREENPIPFVPFPFGKGVKGLIKGKGRFYKRGFTSLKHPRGGDILKGIYTSAARAAGWE